ncbi:MAG: D-amino acid aminotransferase [Ruminococcaceae bacterium]|nr:D-amino acid aminotransferase [Oscillospiraceae bacterium]
MKTLGYYNGTVDELEAMRIPMLDRASYFGDGVYDVTYCRNYRIFALDEHVDRFFQSAELLKITPPLSKNELKALLNELVEKLESGNQWVYFQLSRGTELRNHPFPGAHVPANLSVMLKPAEIRDTYLPLRCITREDTRFLHCNVKSLNLIPNILAKQAATEAGADECILHRDGAVTECSHSNLFILQNGRMITHPANEKIYAGTGRAHLLAACRTQGIPTEERAYTLAELMQADEVIITSASALCVRVVEVDGVPVGGKASYTLKALQDALLKDYLTQTE